MDGFQSEVSESAPHLEVFAPTSQLAAARNNYVGSPASAKGSSSRTTASDSSNEYSVSNSSSRETAHGSSAASPTTVGRSKPGRVRRRKSKRKKALKQIQRPSDEAPKLKPLASSQIQPPRFEPEVVETEASESTKAYAARLPLARQGAASTEASKSRLSEVTIRARGAKTNKLRTRSSPSKLPWLSSRVTDSSSEQPANIVEDADEGSFWVRALTSLPSWLVSTVLHLILLILLALLSMGGDLGKKSVMLEFAEAGEELDTMESEIDFNDIVVEAVPELELAELEPLEMESPEIPLEMMEVFDSADANQLSNDITDEFGFGHSQFGGETGASSSKQGPGARFFGVESSGNRFVFVIDCSGSMQGSRWYRAVKELNEAISNLEPSQEFLVLLYNSGMSVMMNESIVNANLVVANEDNKLRSKRWLRKQRPNGGTYPSQAMFAGLMLDPDAIFLLSDGELQDNTVSLLKVWNVDREDSFGIRSKIPIHTISLGPPGGGQRTMKRIAEDNDGEFTWAQ